MEKFLTVNAEKCTGCRLCEQVCSVKHEGVSNSAKSRIRIVKWEAEGRYVPMICQQCEDAPCKNVCPVGAIRRNKEYGYLEVYHDVCIGCRSCVSICPFGAMDYNKTTHQVFKCDLCGGHPLCTEFCDVKAVEFISADVLAARKKRERAQRQAESKASSVDAGEYA